MLRNCGAILFVCFDMTACDTLSLFSRRTCPQWRAGYHFSGGRGSGLSTNMRPKNVTLDKRGPKARAERRRCEVCLGGSGGMPPGKILNLSL